MLKLNQKLKPASEVVTTELKDEKKAVLLHLGTKMYFSLNETGLRIWQLLGNGLTLGEISKKLEQEFDVTPQKADESVINIAGEFLDEKLVELESE